MLPPWLQWAAVNSAPRVSLTSTLFNRNSSICITCGVWVLMRSWYHIWDFFLCKSSSIRRNYGTLSLALENLQWTNRYHQTSFWSFWLKWKCSEFHTVNPRLQSLQVGLQAWFATTMSSTTQTPTALIWLVHSCLFPLTAPDCFLQRLRVPIFFFFSFRCNKPSSLCSSIVCISLYFIHVLFWCIEVVWNSLFPCGKWPRCCHRTWDTDEWCYFGLSTCSLAR